MPRRFGGAVMTTHELTRAEDGRTVDAFVGDELTLTLFEGGPAGSRWEVEQIDTARVMGGRSASSGVTAPLSAVGVARPATFRFVAAFPGTSVIRLCRRRAGEGEGAAHERFTITLRSTER